MNGTYFFDYDLRFLILKSSDNLTCMTDFNFSGEKDFPESVISALSQWHLPTLSESFTCLCITAGDCFIQSRSAAWNTYLLSSYIIGGFAAIFMDKSIINRNKSCSAE